MGDLVDRPASRYDVLRRLLMILLLFIPQILLHVSHSRQYCCTFLSANIVPPYPLLLNITLDLGSRCAKLLIVVYTIIDARWGMGGRRRVSTRKSTGF